MRCRMFCFRESFPSFAYTPENKKCSINYSDGWRGAELLRKHWVSKKYWRIWLLRWIANHYTRRIAQRVSPLNVTLMTFAQTLPFAPSLFTPKGVYSDANAIWAAACADGYNGTWLVDIDLSENSSKTRMTDYAWKIRVKATYACICALASVLNSSCMTIKALVYNLHWRHSNAGAITHTD